MHIAAVHVYFNLNKAKFAIVLKQNILILQLANRCSIALNQEMFLLLHPFAIRNFSTVL